MAAVGWCLVSKKNGSVLVRTADPRKPVGTPNMQDKYLISAADPKLTIVGAHKMFKLCTNFSFISYDSSKLA